jgi:putative holliday junction resolvase
MRLLGIDYGVKRIGLAISDDSETIANAIAPLVVTGEADALQKISQTISEKQIAKVILGLPVSMSGQEELQAQEVKKFGAKLARLIRQQIDYVDERLTSSQSRTMLAGAGKNYSLDSASAQIILQTYLDLNNKKNE